jgi:crotonobetainyl-CoA:carnitine CoA-transferase CaiB-like acyl-CoA transferase
MFIAACRGKRSMVLDLHQEQDREIVRCLAAQADIFLSNRRAAWLEQLGLGYLALKERNPRLIYALVNGFGPEGPDAGKRMLDGAAQARGGLVHATGYRDGPPALPGALIADSAGAMQLALGIMTALVARERFGVGQRVDVSAYGAQIWLQMCELTQVSITGHPLTRLGGHQANIPGILGVYETADRRGIVLTSVRSEASWQAFWRFAGHDAVGTDPRWDSPQKRTGIGSDAAGDPANQIRPFLERAFRSKPLTEWVAFLDARPDIVYNKVCSYGDVLTDPQAGANDYIVDMDLPTIGRAKVVGNSIRLSETPGTVKGPPPELGQHTEEVLLELGYSWEEVVAVTDRVR